MAKNINRKDNFSKFVRNIVNEIIDYYKTHFDKKISRKKITEMSDVNVNAISLQISELGFYNFLKYLCLSKDLNIHHSLFLNIYKNVEQGKFPTLKELQDKSLKLLAKKPKKLDKPK